MTSIAPGTRPGSEKKKTLALVLITLVTLVLGVIAVFTALRLREYASRPIAPTAPESQPAAFDPVANKACLATLSIPRSACLEWCDEDSDCGSGFYCEKEGETTGVCYSTTCDYTEQDENCACLDEIVCRDKLAHLDSDDYDEGEFDVDTMTTLNQNSRVNTGSVVVYEIKMGGSPGEATIVDTVPAQLEILEVSEGSNYECTISGQIITCEIDGAVPASIFYRARVLTTTAPDTTFTNAVELDDEEIEACVISLKTPLPEATATPAPTNTPAPTATPRPTNPPQATATPAPVYVCNSPCTTDAQCGNDLICYNGLCRNPQCSTEADCVCDGVPGPTATPRPAAPELPQAGNTVATMGILTIGGVLLLAGLVGWLVW